MKIFSEFTKKVEDRKAICEACTNRVKNSLGIMVCGLCGCPIATKSLVPSTKCPDTPPKW